MAEASSSFSVAQPERPTFGAVIGKAIRFQILGHDRDPPGNTCGLNIGLIGEIVWIGLVLDEVIMSCLFGERSLEHMEGPVEVPPRGLYHTHHRTGTGDFAIESEDIVLVAGIATPHKNTITPLQIQFVYHFDRDVP